MLWIRRTAVLIAAMVAGAAFGNDSAEPIRVASASADLLPTEKLQGNGVWIDPAFKHRKPRKRDIRITVWFDEQFLGDGDGYRRRAREFSGWRRRELRAAVLKTLKSLSQRSYETARENLESLEEAGTIRDVERHWIVNGFSCTLAVDALHDLKTVPGVSKIFSTNEAMGRSFKRKSIGENFTPPKPKDFDPDRYLHPWYTRSVLADRVWKQFGVTGRGTLNVVHDYNFLFTDNVTRSLFRNPREIPGNGKDDDQNGRIDDYHGFNFGLNSPKLTVRPDGNHGMMCAAIICGRGEHGKEYEFGIAPEASWAGVIAGSRLVDAIEWAVEQHADTYSMSFSSPGLGEYRSHWRKVMEHGSFCGVYFVSGANFAQSAPIPVQMRVPEDIPDVVFAAAGVQRNLTRTPFSSQGPVKWETEHYHDGIVQKPEVCAFNMGLPALRLDGSVRETGLNGNSFAGPMLCGAIALMLSADPDVLPWDLKQIITSTAFDVAATGVDDQTGHGLINCYRAVKEVLRRKAIRDGENPGPYSSRENGDELDISALRKKLKLTRLKVVAVQPESQAAKDQLKPGDVILRYDGHEIRNQQDVKRAQAAAETDLVPVVVKRNDETVELKFKPGLLGAALTVQYDEPTFD